MKIKLLSIAASIALLFCPNISFGQAPTLGTTANFVLFTSSGAVTNVGPSHVTGNVGSNVGAGTGFGNVNGVMNSSNGVTALAAADLLTAYGQLNTTIPGFFLASPLGNGSTLTAGVYSLSANTVLSNTLTLNAAGNANAVFIFLISGTFSSNSNSKIILTNGALACNVFWKIEGAVSLGSGSSLKGTMIANNAAITMATGVTLEGRALSTTGAIGVTNVLVYTPIGCGSLFLTGPASPTLASTACYALFTTNGANTNVGVTTVTGDIGSNNGLTTGYNPLFVSGSVHAIPDLSTAQCATDLGFVYTYLNTLPFDIELLYPAQFGNSLVLTPHSYLMNAATMLTDTVFLNGQNNPSAVFVIKINGALTTSVFSKVVLTNGTQAKNVFWKVDGAVSINNNSTFRGTIICNNGAINLNTAVFLDGRALTTTGALSTSAVTVAITPGCSTGAPNITSEPSSQTVCAGSSVSFSVAATGAGLTYQWRKGNVNLINGGTISGATSTILTINPVTVADAAINYNVVVTGSFAPSYTSQNVSLVVNTSPSITTQPVSQTVCPGSSVSFSVVATGSSLTYQWRNGTVNLINGAPISGATSANLTISPVSGANASINYNVIVSGGCAPNFTSVNVSLVISTSSSITSQPLSQTVCAGSAANFSVAATGGGLTYQWRNGLVNLINGGTISGVTSATLTISPVSSTNASTNYNVIIGGGCSSNFTSVNVSLVVNPSPTITAMAVSQTVCEGGQVSFPVTATGTGLIYQWRNGTVNLNNGGTISGATSATLTINPVSIADASSNYNVIINGGCTPNYTSVNVSLVVNASPSITVFAVSQTVCVGSPVSFPVVASGTGLTYQWSNGTVNLSNGGSISGATSATLTINPVSLADASGNYNVIINGGCTPNFTSANVSLAVSASPTILVQPVSQTVCAGSPASFPVTTTGTGLTFQWRKGLVNLSNGGTISGATSATLVINPVSLADASTNYNLVISGACSANYTSVNVSLSVNPVLVASANGNSSVCAGSSINLTAQIASDASYNWTGPNGYSSTLQNPVILSASVANAGTYSLTVSSQSCTSAPSTILISVNKCADFFIPEGYSPNGDGINDVFVIRGIINYPDNHFVIFNRWGNKVFEASPYQDNWDGRATMGLRVGGDELPVGTYFYILDLHDGTPVYKGTIYLNR